MLSEFHRSGPMLSLLDTGETRSSLLYQRAEKCSKASAAPDAEAEAHRDNLQFLDGFLVFRRLIKYRRAPALEKVNRARAEARPPCHLMRGHRASGTPTTKYRAIAEWLRFISGQDD